MADKLLAVDDNLSMRKLFEDFFKKRFEIKTASEPREAFAIIEAGFIPNIVVSDYSMPGMSGLQMIGILKEKKRLLCQVVLMSGDISEITAADKLFLKYVDEIIQKPFLMSDFLKRVGYLFEV